MECSVGSFLILSNPLDWTISGSGPLDVLITKALRVEFAPDFLIQIDETIIFKSLSRTNYKRDQDYPFATNPRTIKKCIQI